MRIFSGNSSSLRTAKLRFVLCMHINRYAQFRQLTTNTNTKNLASFVSSEGELKPRFPKVHCFFWSFPATPTCLCTNNAETTDVSAQINASVFAVRIHHPLPLAADHQWSQDSLHRNRCLYVSEVM